MLAQEPHPVLSVLRLSVGLETIYQVCRTWAGSSFVNKSLLEQSYAHLCLGCLQLHSSRVEELQQRPCGLHSLKYLPSGPLRKSLPALLEKIILFQEQPSLMYLLLSSASFPPSTSFLLLLILPQLYSSFTCLNFFLQQKRQVTTLL